MPSDILRSPEALERPIFDGPYKPVYLIRDLAAPSYLKDPAAYGLNPSGAVAGTAVVNRVFGDRATGVVWTQGAAKAVPLLPAGLTGPGREDVMLVYHSVLRALNAHGVAVGWREFSSGTDRAAIQVDAKGLSYIPIAGVDSAAIDINDAGTVCGWRGKPVRGFSYHPTTAPRDVGLPNTAVSRARAINNLGEIAGVSDGKGFFDFAEGIKDLGSVRDIGGINDGGMVVGWQSRPGPRVVPVSCDARSARPGWADIPLPKGFTNGEARRINSFGHVVGTCWTSSKGLYGAFIHKDGVSIDLNYLVDAPEWVLTHATDINDDGMICGYGTRSGKPAAWLLTPIPLLNPVIDWDWPIRLPKGPPGPFDDAGRDTLLLMTLSEAASSIADQGVRERVQATLVESAGVRAADASASLATAAPARTEPSEGAAETLQPGAGSEIE